MEGCRPMICRSGTEGRQNVRCQSCHEPKMFHLKWFPQGRWHVIKRERASLLGRYMGGTFRCCRRKLGVVAASDLLMNVPDCTLPTEYDRRVVPSMSIPSSRFPLWWMFHILLLAFRFQGLPSLSSIAASSKRVSREIDDELKSNQDARNQKLSPEPPLRPDAERHELAPRQCVAAWVTP